MEREYVTVDLYEAAAIETLTGVAPSLRPVRGQLVQLAFNGSPELDAVVDSYHNGALIDAKRYATTIAKNFAIIKSMRYGGGR